MPALWTCELTRNTPIRRLTPSLLSPLRSEESALQASGRRAEERQEALWRSEPAAGQQWRRGHVTRGQCMCWGGGGGYWEKRTDSEWRMTSERQVFVASREMIMYIYYIRVLSISRLFYSSSSVSLWRTGTRWDWFLKRLKGSSKNLWRAKCLNLFLWFHNHAVVFVLMPVFLIISTLSNTTPLGFNCV